MLKMAGNTRTYGDYPLFDQAAIYRWNLEELDLSGIAVRYNELVPMLIIFTDDFTAQRCNC